MLAVHGVEKIRHDLVTEQQYGKYNRKGYNMQEQMYTVSRELEGNKC